MTSRIVQCEGLVLRNLRFGDTSRIFTLFTREAGKLGVMAKGARDPKSAFGASLELFIRGGYILYYRAGRDLQLLRSAWVEQEYVELVRSPRRYVFGAATLEFLDRVLLEDEPLPEIYDLTCRALEVLERAPEPGLGEIFRHFQLRVAALLGYAPRLDACLHCGARAPESDSRDERAWLFRVAEGGVFCPECAPGQDGLLLRPRAVRRLAALTSGRTADRATNSSVIRDRAVDPAWGRALDRVVEEYLQFHLDRYRRSRSLDTLAGIEGENKTAEAKS